MLTSVSDMSLDCLVAIHYGYMLVIIKNDLCAWPRNECTYGVCGLKLRSYVF